MNVYKIIFSTLVFLFFLSENVWAQSKSNNYFRMPSQISKEEYLPKTILLKIKPAYRNNITTQTELNKYLSNIGVQNFNRKFPNHNSPERQYDPYGHPYTDLTLIYFLRYSENIPLEKVINALYHFSFFEYVQPHYIPKVQGVYIPNDPSISSQYSVTNMKADSAWGVNTTSARGDTNVVIGITDTGIELSHPDLMNVKYNYADPLDGNDNDGDGYTDNFNGWDLGENDNDPTWQTNYHGVHVTGIAAASTDNSQGIAGIGFKCKYLPVKIGNASGQLVAAYEGIVYAADHNCFIINCSWGSPYFSPYQDDIIAYATVNKNSLVVTACGNGSSNTDFYPSSCPYAISVAAVDNSDVKVGLSNYAYAVDMCAGGSSILSTTPSGGYGNLTGTSQASPNVAGAAGIVKSFFSSYTALQVGEQLKVTCDNIYPLNSSTYAEKLGGGRVNIYRAITNTSSPSLVLTQHTETDNSDNITVIGDTIRLRTTLMNYLAATGNISATLTAISGASYLNILNSTTIFGIINTLSSKNNNADPFQLKIKTGTPLNQLITLQLHLSDGTYSCNQYFNIYINNDYINIAVNDIATTNTSTGLIGYNGSSQQGLGFQYKNCGSLFNQCGFMIGTSSVTVSDVVDGETDFATVATVRKIPNVISDFDVDGVFNDANAFTPLNIQIHHSSYAWIAAGFRKFVIFKYNIKNTGSSALNNLYAGIFADWDLYNEYSLNYDTAAFDAANELGYASHISGDSTYAGIRLLSDTAPVMHYVIDYTNGGAGGVDITDGFDNAEKFTALSTNRHNPGTAGGVDVAEVVSTGPFSINAGDSLTIGFALLAGDSLPDLKTSAQNAKTKWNYYFTTLPIAEIKAEKTTLLAWPNPANNEVIIAFSPNEKADLLIYDAMGRLVEKTGQIKNGRCNLNVSEYKNGIYYCRIANSNVSLKIVVLH